MKLPPGGSLSGLLAELAAFARRRRAAREPRVRIRVAHGEAEVLAAGSPEQGRLLSLAAELVDEYGNVARDRG